VTLFLATFFLLYGGMHCYAFLRTRAALHFGLPTGLVLAALMILMILAPVIVRQSEKAGFDSLARVAAYAGYLWMGGLFIFFTASILIDLCRLILYGLWNLIRADSCRFTSAYGWFFGLALFAALFVVIYGYFDALRIRTEHVVLSSSKINAGIGKIKIVQISDVHLGLIVRGDRLEGILQKVREADPDLLLATGDLVDGQIDGLSELVEPLAQLKPKYGKFAITGNHEYHAGISNSREFIAKAGFVLLRGEGRTIGDVLNLAGIDDEAGRFSPGYREIADKDLLSGLPRGLFTILLKHRPVVDSRASGLFDLQLSGHVHKGQIFPFRLITRLFFPYVGGSYPLSDGAMLHVSRGSGTWGPPIRFLAPPEVTVIEVLPAPTR
jgi:uncharacterized protein